MSYANEPLAQIFCAEDAAFRFQWVRVEPSAAYANNYCMCNDSPVIEDRCLICHLYVD